MNTCATSQGRRVAMRCAAALLALAFAGASPGARADGGGAEGGLRFDGEATLGVRFYAPGFPGNVDGLTGYFDQYRYVHDKDAGPPTHIDVFDLEAGWYRDDGTPFVYLERRSPHRLGERGLVAVDHERFHFDLDYHRFRNDELRIFPLAASDGFAQVASPDFDPNLQPLGEGSRFYTQRTGVGGELGVRLDDLSLANPLLEAISFTGSFDRRQGARQQRFLLDPGVEVSANDQAYRSYRQRFEQDVVDLAGQLILAPADLFTAVLDVGFESFRENEAPTTLASLQGLGAIPVVVPVAARGPRAVKFVPDTDQVEASLRVSRRLRNTHLQAGGSFVRVAQAGARAPFTAAQGFGDAELRFFSGHASLDVPLADWLGEDFAPIGFNAIVRVDHRDNALDTDAFGVALAGDQVNFWIEERTQVRADFEATLNPRRGIELGAGYRLHSVGRDLRDTTGGGTLFITDDVNLIEDETLRHTFYGRLRARAAYGIRLNAEAGYEAAPKIGLPRELDDVVYVETRASGRSSLVFPLGWSAHARIRQGQNDGITLRDANTARKDFERMSWRYGLQLDGQPTERSALYASFSHDRDDQQFSFLRTYFSRTTAGVLPGAVSFLLDSRPEYRADTRSLVLGGSLRLIDQLTASGSFAFTWVDVDYVGGSNTETLLSANSAIDQKILSVDTELAFTPNERVSLLLGYRADRFSDGRDLQPLVLDELVHTVTLALRLPLGIFDRN